MKVYFKTGEELDIHAGWEVRPRLDKDGVIKGDVLRINARNKAVDNMQVTHYLGNMHFDFKVRSAIRGMDKSMGKEELLEILSVPPRSNLYVMGETYLIDPSWRVISLADRIEGGSFLGKVRLENVKDDFKVSAEPSIDGDKVVWEINYVTLNSKDFMSNTEVRVLFSNHYSNLDVV